MGNTGSVISDAFDDIGKGFSVVSKQIETGVGAVGQSVGDLFYPDNPNRRKRVEQLQDDIKVMQNEFESLKKTLEETLAEMQKKLDELLKANNFNSVEEMDEFMQKTLNPNTLQEWNEFKKTLNRDVAFENMIMTATGLLTIATGVIAYGLAICGAITFASAGTALSVVGGVALALLAAVAILAIIDGGNEREELHKAIHKLAFARVEAKQALEQLRIHLRFLSQFSRFLSSRFSSEPEMFNEYTSGNFMKAMEDITWPRIVEQLRDLDNHRPEGAWKAEDPNVWAPPNGKTDPVYDILQKWRKEEENRNGLLTATSLNHMISSHQKMGKLWSNKDMLTSYSGLTCYNSFPKMESTWESKLRGDPDHEQPVIQFIHEQTDVEGDIHPQQFRLQKCKSALECDVEDVKTGHAWHIRANLGEKPASALSLKDITFTLTDLTDSTVFQNCKILLLGHATVKL